MINYKKIMKEYKDVESVTCDKCKKEYDHIFEIQEFHYIRIQGGYNSIFGDGSIVECDICQHCLHDMISKICRFEGGD